MLGGRERVDACETLLLRVRADLDAGRAREAALQLRPASRRCSSSSTGRSPIRTTLEDMATLSAGAAEAATAANAAVGGEIDGSRRPGRGAARIGERVLRRRRVLRGG